MDQGELGGEALVGQVGEERLELAGGEHALVDEGAARQRREVDLDLALGPLAQAEGEAVEVDAPWPRTAAATKSWRKVRHALAGGLADEVGR